MFVMLMLIGLAQSPEPADQKLADFSRLIGATGDELVIVERDGTVLEGRLTAATEDTITMRFASGDRVFAKSAIAGADRRRDGSSDGFIKGAAVGTVIALIARGLGARGNNAYWLRGIGTYAVLGWALDAGVTNRQPIYRAPYAPDDPRVKLSFRF